MLICVFETSVQSFYFFSHFTLSLLNLFAFFWHEDLNWLIACSLTTLLLKDKAAVVLLLLLSTNPTKRPKPSSALAGLPTLPQFVCGSKPPSNFICLEDVNL